MESSGLSWGACVFGFALLVDASDVADADTVEVVSSAMCADLLYWSPSFDFAAEGDDIVIAYVAPALLFVPRPDCVGVYVSPLWGGGAMEYDVCYFSHCFLFLRFWFMRSVTLLMVVPKPRRVAAKMSSCAMR